MAAKTFDEWDCIKDCAVEDRQCPRCEEAWNAATKAAEEKFNSAAQSGPTNKQSTQLCDDCATNKVAVSVCEPCLLKMIHRGA